MLRRAMCVLALVLLVMPAALAPGHAQVEDAAGQADDRETSGADARADAASPAGASGPSGASPVQPTPQALSLRPSTNVVVITVLEPIDRVTVASVGRRLRAAEASSADAVVIEIDSPGGEVGAVLALTKLLKNTPVPHTLAWVRGQAISGAALTALACREMVVTRGALMGDALPVRADPMTGGIAPLKDDELKKLLGPLLRDVVTSARAGDYDELIAQGMVIDGTELWLARHAPTQRVFAVSLDEARLLAGRDPSRGRPMLINAGSRLSGTIGANGPGALPSPGPGSGGGFGTGGMPPIDPAIAAPDPSAAATADTAPSEAASTEEFAFNPASAFLAELAGDPNLASLALASRRPLLTPQTRREWSLVGYLHDGSLPITMSGDELRALGFARTVVTSDDELKAFLAATTVVRLEPSWSERVARVLEFWPIQVGLIAVFIIGLVIEMISPGLIAPATIALIAAGLLMWPLLLTDAAGWWELGIIGIGVVLLGVEVFVLPGMGLAGAAGIGCLIVGLVAALLPDSGSDLFGQASFGQIGWTLAIVLMGMLTAGVGVYFISRRLGSIPVLDRMILRSPAPARDRSPAADPTAASWAPPGMSWQPKPGTPGIAATSLRPTGKGDFTAAGGDVIEVSSEDGVLDPGSPIVISSVSRFRVTVKRAAGQG